MLTEINIKNIALIESLRIEFGQGFNVLTGETGAGKSIVVDCVNLALGQRADRDLIRTGCDRGSVRALFDISKTPSALDFLCDRMIDADDGIVEVSRELTKEGKNVCRVNGTLLPLSVLKSFTALLVDIHGQHEHQNLLNPEKHISYLDDYGSNTIKQLKNDVASVYSEYKKAAQTLKQLSMDEAERVRRLDMLKFQYQEISKAKLNENEEEELKRKNLLFENSEKISSHLHTAYERIYAGGKSMSAQESVKKAVTALEAIGNCAPEYAALAARLNETLYTLKDIGYELQDAVEDLQFDPDEAEKTADRLELVKQLKRKYGSDVKAIIDYGRQAEAEIKTLSEMDDLRSEAEESCGRLKRTLKQKADALTAARQQTASALEQAILGQLKDLGMAKTRFEIRIAAKPEMDSNGGDNVEFFISPNPGEPLKPLSAVASGGEISRVMLAIKAVSCKSDGIETMIFDEIDTGVSGKMAQTVGEKMCMLGQEKQVICVTHLAQIAALADTHFVVEKTATDDRTNSIVKRLDNNGRIGEIARLVGGADISASGIEHAANMIKAASDLKRRGF